MLLLPPPYFPADSSKDDFAFACYFLHGVIQMSWVENCSHIVGLELVSRFSSLGSSCTPEKDVWPEQG